MHCIIVFMHFLVRDCFFDIRFDLVQILVLSANMWKYYLHNPINNYFIYSLQSGGICVIISIKICNKILQWSNAS